MDIRLSAKRVHESYLRAGGKKFIASFYDRLTAASDEIKKRFEHVNMKKQEDILAHAVVMSFLFVDPNHQIASKAIKNVRMSHNREHLNIEPHLYDTWLNCLIETVAECDPLADEELLAQWREVMSVAINHIKEGY